MNFVDEGVDIDGVKGFAEVKGYNYCAFRWLFLVESLGDLGGDLVKCCVRGVECFEAMLVFDFWGVVIDDRK